MKLIVASAFYIFTLAEVIAQSINPSFIKEKSEVGIFSPQKNEGKKRLERYNKNIVVVSFHEGFSDSLHVYVGDSLYMKQFVKSDSLGLGYACAAININFKNLKSKRKNLVIVMPQSKIYTIIKIDRNYALVKIHHLESIWYVVKTNYVPEYQ